MIETFFDNEEDYLKWLTANSSGYVVNCYKTVTKSGGPWMLHKAICHTLEKENATTGQYYKVCSQNRDELIEWADSKKIKVGYTDAMQHCKKCNP